MSWRPEEWQNPYPSSVSISRGHPFDERMEHFLGEQHGIFEAGADEMLEALRKSSDTIVVQNGDTSLTIPLTGRGESFSVVFIPSKGE